MPNAPLADQRRQYRTLQLDSEYVLEASLVGFLNSIYDRLFFLCKEIKLLYNIVI